jgi:hypothetical protein
LNWRPRCREPEGVPMKITDVVVLEVSGRCDLPPFPPGDRQAQMADVYPDANAHDWARQRPPGPHGLRALYVEVRTSAELTGLFGPDR